MNDEFGNYIGCDPKPSWRERNEHRIHALKFWWPEVIVVIAVVLAGGLASYYAATRLPAATVTLDRSEWACTQTAHELAYVTPQGIPISRTKCMQWSRQP